MRSYDEYKQIMELWEAGVNKKAISRITNIPRRTVIDCIQRYENLETLERLAKEDVTPLLLKILHGDITGDYTVLHSTYAYVLGVYLGDGHISKVRNVYRMRVACDAKYPNLINTIVTAFKTLMPTNEVSTQDVLNHGKPSCVVVSLYHRDLPLFFPQHGDGAKHDRLIELELWQQRILIDYPLEVLRGLYHSDGSRFINRVNVGGKDYSYSRYQFTNASKDIIQLFCDTSDRLGLHWTRKLRRARAATHVDNYDIYISKRKDVEYLDSVIGAKS